VAQRNLVKLPRSTRGQPTGITNWQKLPKNVPCACPVTHPKICNLLMLVGISDLAKNKNNQKST